MYYRYLLPAIIEAASLVAAKQDLNARAFVPGQWGLVQSGTTGVSAQQLAVVTETTVIIYDKVENNPMTVDGHIAWSSEFNLNTHTARPLNPQSNSWCAAGSFLGNGTFINTGGNPVVNPGVNGLQAVRIFTPCEDQSCDVEEYRTRVRLTSARWYPSSVRLDDGSVMILGGSTSGGYINNGAFNNPTYEFFPPKNINGFNGLQIPMQFMQNTLNSNHFPNMISLPDGNLFISANTQAMLFDWKTNTGTSLPSIPNGVRISSPFSAGAVLLPLSPTNNYTPEVMICGGSTVSDNADPSSLSSQTPASDQCIRMVLNDAGIAAGWQVEHMLEARVMGELILLPDGRVLVVNGAQTGVAGYGNVGDQVGESNADNPAFTPAIYDPNAPAGSRFTHSGLPASTIPRLYHSTASLTPNGTVIIAGSNPNDNVETHKYPTEYRVEFFSPPYMNEPRPSYTGLPSQIGFGASFDLSVTLPSNTSNVTVALMDLGFATHAVHMDIRLVYLEATLNDAKTTLSVTAPPSGGVYPPGPGFLYVVTDQGVPSFGHKVLVGDGSVPVDEAAIENMLSHTSNPTFRVAEMHKPATGEGSNIPTDVIPAPP